MHICTVCDNKYLLKGLALYQSLLNTIPGKSFTLHWLCIDDTIYDTLSKAQLPNIVIYKLSELEKQSIELQRVKENPPPCEYGDKYAHYCWTLPPWFVCYLLKTVKPDQLLSADSDIFFYEDPNEIFDVMMDDPVGIHTHRFTGTIEQQPMLDDGIGTKLNNGWYNQGVMAFNYSPQAIHIAEAWKSWVMNADNPFYEKYGTCSDQKYLELFIPLFGTSNICVFDYGVNSENKSSIIFHQAPWCPENQFNRSPLFYHFSHFNCDLEKNTWSDSNKGEWTPASFQQVRQLYRDYFEVIKMWSSQLPIIISENEINTTSGIVESPGNNQPLQVKPTNGTIKPVSFKIDIIGNIKIDESKPERIKMLIASIRSFRFLSKNARFILLIENASLSLQNKVRLEMTQCGFDYMLLAAGFGDFGKSSSILMKSCKSPYIMTFLEDHFCMCDSVDQVQGILGTMEHLRVDLLKTSFFNVEMNSIKGVELFHKNDYGYVFDNTIINHNHYQKHYHSRYYISIHFLATRTTAAKFFARELGKRPHEYEILNFTSGWEHRCMVPAQELLCSIDDEHGELKSNLLSRPDATKFWDVYNEIK